MTNTATAQTVRVLVALDVPAEQAQDIPDLLASIEARLADEAGYLDTGEPIAPVRVITAVSDCLDPINPNTLGGAFEVGMEGADQDMLHWETCPVVSPSLIESDVLGCTCEV